MAERRNKRDVCLEYTFDRLLVAKLEQVYRTLVPDRVRVVGESAPAQVLCPASLARSSAGAW